MNINNGQLLSLLFFDEPKLAKALKQAIPYISVFKEKTTLNLRCVGIATFSTLLQYRQEICRKINPLLGYEIRLECEETGVKNLMVATAERRINETSSTTETKFLSLETLERATSKSPQEVKKLLGKARQVIHLMEDGSEMITENAFDNVVLEWAKSFKGGSNGSQIPISTPAPTSSPKSNRGKSNTKILVSELTIGDIVIIKNGKSVNSPNLTERGVRQTLENFFGKIKMENMSKVDVISAFIEGTSEFGQALWKKLISAYQKFTKDPNLEEVRNKLTDGAKAYLENIASPAAEEKIAHPENIASSVAEE